MVRARFQRFLALADASIRTARISRPGGDSVRWGQKEKWLAEETSTCRRCGEVEHTYLRCLLTELNCPCRTGCVPERISPFISTYPPTNPRPTVGCIRYDAGVMDIFRCKKIYHTRGGIV